MDDNNTIPEAMAKDALAELTRLTEEARDRYRQHQYRQALSSLEALGEVLGPLTRHLVGAWSNHLPTAQPEEESGSQGSSPLTGQYL